MPFNCQSVFWLIYQLLIALRARARPIKSRKTMKSSESLAKGPTTIVSAIFAMRFLNLCERGAWILQIEMMSAFFGVRLNLLRSGDRCHDERRQSFELNKGSTVVKAIRWRIEWSIKKETSDPSIQNHLL